jgi:hypothetical protein
MTHYARIATLLCLQNISLCALLISRSLYIKRNDILVYTHSFKFDVLVSEGNKHSCFPWSSVCEIINLFSPTFSNSSLCKVLSSIEI